MINEVKDRLVSPKTIQETQDDGNLRPKSLDDFIGQKKTKTKISMILNAAKGRDEACDHILLSGPPGLGKTTLANIVAGELGSNIRITSGPTLTKTGDVAKLLTELEEKDVIFIDEIHRLSRSVEEVLYSAMEDYKLDIIIGKAATSKTLRLPLKRFTLIGATTMSGLLSSPLRDRFGIHIRLDYYEEKELTSIIDRYSKLLNINMLPEASKKLACCSRGTPRIALRILKRVRDYSQTENISPVTSDIVQKTLKILDIDMNGLDFMDKKIMQTIMEKFSGGPVSLDTIAMSIGEEARSIYEVYEPYLLQIGFLSRTPRGRIATDVAYQYFGISR
ncbi:MAG: Holliday junction branch migration DNA helicase RuvB [Candidatus Muiribacteriota bacterium]